MSGEEVALEALRKSQAPTRHKCHNCIEEEQEALDRFLLTPYTAREERDLRHCCEAASRNEGKRRTREDKRKKKKDAPHTPIFVNSLASGFFNHLSLPVQNYASSGWLGFAAGPGSSLQTKSSPGYPVSKQFFPLFLLTLSNLDCT